MSSRRPALHVATLLLTLASAARAQEPGLPVEPIPEARPMDIPSGSISERPLTFGLGAGIDDSGPFLAMRLGLGFSPASSIRLDLVGTVALGQPSIPGYDAVLGRASAELRLGYRVGDLQPWIGGGLMAASLGGDGPTTPNQPFCLTSFHCIPTGSSTAQLDGSTHGSVAAAGIQVAVRSWMLLGVEVRKAFLPVEGFGGTGVLLSMVFFKG